MRWSRWLIVALPPLWIVQTWGCSGSEDPSVVNTPDAGTGGSAGIGGAGGSAGIGGTGGSAGHSGVGGSGGDSGPPGVCTPGADQTCNDDPNASALWGSCTASGTCVCKTGFDKNPSTGKCRPADGGVPTVCTVGMDQTCNDDIYVSAYEGTCVNGSCVCNSGYVLNSATGKCGIVDGGPPQVCSPGKDETCNLDTTVSALWGKCLPNGTCQCNSGFVIDAPTGKCTPTTSIPIVLASGQSMPWGLAVDATTVFWSNQGTGAAQGEIRATPIASGAILTLALGQAVPSEVALDASKVFWVNYAGGGSVMSMGKDGTGIASLASGSGPLDIATDSDSVYWTNVDGIAKVIKQGGSSTTLVTSEQDPRAVAVDDTKVYWTASGSGSIGAADKSTGAGKHNLATGQAAPQGLVVTPTAVFWVNAGSYMAGACDKADGTIMKLATGSSTPVVLASNQACPLRLAVDADAVYWTNSGTYQGAVYVNDGAVMSVAVQGGTPSLRASGNSAISPLGIAVDANNIYWTALGLGASSGSVIKLAKK